MFFLVFVLSAVGVFLGYAYGSWRYLLVMIAIVGLAWLGLGLNDGLYGNGWGEGGPTLMGLLSGSFLLGLFSGAAAGHLSDRDVGSRTNGHLP